MARSHEAMAAEVGSDAHVQALEEAAALDPAWLGVRQQLAEAHFMRSIERYRSAEWEGVERDLLRAIETLESAPDGRTSDYAQYLVGYYAEQLGRFGDAARAYRRAAALDPSGHVGTSSRAAAAVIERAWPEAISAAAVAIASDPEDAMPYFRRSAARLALGEAAGALEDARRASDRLRTDDWIQGQLVRALLAAGEPRLAALRALEGLKHFPRSPVLTEVLAAIARREGAEESAQKLGDRVRRAGAGGLPPYLACAGEPWAAPRDPERRRRLLETVGRAAEGSDAHLAALLRAIFEMPADPALLRRRAAWLRGAGRALEASEDEALADLLEPRE